MQLNALLHIRVYDAYAWYVRLSVYQFGRIWKLHPDDDDDDSELR